MQQLGDKLETNLRAQEMQLDQVPREQAAKRRATLVKLSRDFRKIEGACKNLMLETRRKKARLAEQKKQAQFAANQGQLPEEEQRIQLELQLQQEVSGGGEYDHTFSRHKMTHHVFPHFRDLTKTSCGNARVKFATLIAACIRLTKFTR